MTVKRLLRRSAWGMITIATVIATGSVAAAPEQRQRDFSLRRLTSTYVYDGDTTYCWATRANVSNSDVTDDLIFVRGSKADCPLTLHIDIGNVSSVRVGQNLVVTWNVAAATTINSALFTVRDAPSLVDKRTRQRATIIHSNVHTCRVGTGCDAFRQGQTDTNATTNQIGNLSAVPVSFSTNEVVFTSPGKQVVLAHIIIPGPTMETRYDFAVFTTVDVMASAIGTTVQGNGNTNQPDDGTTSSTRSSSSHTMSMNQMVILIIVGGSLFVLFLIVIVYAKRNAQPLLCRRKRDDSSAASTKGSNFCVRGSNLRTRSSDWTELYAIDDMLPVSNRTDDGNTIAILNGSSRNSTPCSTPVTTDRTIADFRHDVARWDERPSASPITPSSSAILIAAIQDPDAIANTPSNDCFVPIEMLVATSPPAVCVRLPSPPPLASPPRTLWKKPFRNSGRKRRQRKQPKHPPPEDSGDEQEVDM